MPTLNRYLENIKSRIASWNDRDREAYELTPYRDWVALLYVSGVFIFIAAAIGFYLFIEINSGEIFGVSPEENAAVRTINKKLLNQTLADYAKKEKEFNDIMVKTPALVDPSR